MPESLLHDLRVNLRRKQVAGMAVPQAVQRDAVSLQEGRNSVGKAARLQGRPVGLGGDLPAVIGPDAQPKRLLGLSEPPAAELFNDQGGQGYGPRPAAFRGSRRQRQLRAGFPERVKNSLPH
jgi:hypothetical protein